MSEPDNGEICQHCGMTFGDHAFGGRWCMPLSKGTRFVSGEDCQLTRLTAGNAALRERIKELEAFVAECANDTLDRVSPGIKQAARQALTPAKEGV